MCGAVCIGGLQSQSRFCESTRELTWRLPIAEKKERMADDEMLLVFPLYEVWVWDKTVLEYMGCDLQVADRRSNKKSGLGGSRIRSIYYTHVAPMHEL